MVQVVTPAKTGVQFRRWTWIPAFAGMTMLIAITPASAQEKATPYWASIASGQAMTRTGPAKHYPGIWLYQRRDLPVRVLKRYENWRLIEDPDGAKGWMLMTLLSDRRTALIKPGEQRPIRSEPSGGARVRYLAEPGVVGRVGDCRNGWCRIEVGGKKGYIAVADIWGIGANEVVE
jgi:SH3-like domain-containing protein